MRLQRTKNRKLNKFRFAVIVICLCVFCYSAWHVGSNYWRAYKSQRAAEEEAKRIQEQIDEAIKKAEEEKKNQEQSSQNGSENSGSDTQEGQQGQEGGETQQDYEFVLNFDYLNSVNPDIMGWLQVDGTNINYPILYSYEDRAYYLSHNYLCEYDPQGSIYIENFNSRDMSDFNTIVYGHSMLNGNMFGTLHSFEDWWFFNNYGNVRVYTADATYYYQVFETATIDDSHIFTYLDNGSYQSRASYVERLAGYTNGFKKDGYSVSPDDHILTLSTCTTDDTKRLVVFAVLVSTTTN